MALKKTQKFRNITWTTLRLSRIWGTLFFDAFRTSYRARPFCTDELKGQLICPINVKPEIHWVTINTLLISSSLQISMTPPTFLISVNHTTVLSHWRPEWYLTFMTLSYFPNSIFHKNLHILPPKVSSYLTLTISIGTAWAQVQNLPSLGDC